MKKVVSAFDIGSTNLHAILGRIYDDSKLEIIGSVMHTSQGLKQGVINDSEDFKKSLAEFKRKVDNVIGYNDYPVVIGLNGVYFSSKKTKGVVALAENEVVKDDIKRALNQASSFNISENRLNIEALPIDYTVDNERSIKNPLGLHGIKLEANILLIEAFASYFKNIEEALNSSGINIRKIHFSPLTTVHAVCTKKQKELGCVIVDIGGTTTTVVVIEEGSIIHIKVLPIGANHITSDIVYGLKINFNNAEEIKIKYGTLLKGKKDEKIDLSKIDPEMRDKVDRAKLIEIIESRVKEIFDNVNSELKKINRQRMLPGGVILIGGGARLRGVAELAKNSLELPSQIGYPLEISGLIEEVNSPAFAGALGLLKQYILSSDDEGGINLSHYLNKIKGLFKNLMP